MKLRNLLIAATLALLPLSELNAENLKDESSLSRRSLPGSKMAIEIPLKKLISEGTGAAGFSIPRPSSVSRPASQDAASLRETLSNKKVLTGLVEWHADLQAAALSSRRSGKPVLLFQMVGRLDEEFC